MSLARFSGFMKPRCHKCATRQHFVLVLDAIIFGTVRIDVFILFYFSVTVLYIYNYLKCFITEKPHTHAVLVAVL